MSTPPKGQTPFQTAADTAQADALALLRCQLQGWEQTFHTADREVFSTGCREWDQLLPQQGLLAGQLVEWLGMDSGSECLALWIARQVLARHPQQMFVVIDGEQQLEFYPPSAIAWGISPRQLVVLRLRNMSASAASAFRLARSKRRRGTEVNRASADLLWALDQSLRCPAIGVVLAHLPHIDPRDFRRLQLAAEEGKTLGMLLRAARLRGQPSWADLQFAVQPLPGNFSRQSPSSRATHGNHHQPRRAPPVNQVCEFNGTRPVALRRYALQLLRCRQGAAGGSMILQIDEVSRTIRGCVSGSAVSAQSG